MSARPRTPRRELEFLAERWGKRNGAAFLQAERTDTSVCGRCGEERQGSYADDYRGCSCDQAEPDTGPLRGQLAG